MGIRSEKCVVGRFRRCANVIQCTYTNLDSIAYYTSRLYGINLTASFPMCLKTGYKDYISQSHLVIIVVEFLHGRHVSTSSRSSSGPNLSIEILHKLTHKIQVGIPVASRTFYTYRTACITRFYSTYTVSNWNPNLRFISRFT